MNGFNLFIILIFACRIKDGHKSWATGKTVVIYFFSKEKQKQNKLKQKKQKQIKATTTNQLEDSTVGRVRALRTSEIGVKSTQATSSLDHFDLHYKMEIILSPERIVLQTKCNDIREVSQKQQLLLLIPYQDYGGDWCVEESALMILVRSLPLPTPSLLKMCQQETWRESLRMNW